MTSKKNIALYINTTAPDEIVIAVRAGQDNIAAKRIKAIHTQAEKLVPAINRLLTSQRIALAKLQKIVVANRGGSFTSLRIGVITANALAYALKIPVEAEPKTAKKNKRFGAYSLVEPSYDREPIIGVSKKPRL